MISRTFKILLVLIYTAAYAGPSFSSEPGSSRASDKSQEETREEFVAAQKRAMKIYDYLEKARDMRRKDRLSKARAHAEKALIIEKDNREVLAFLEYLTELEGSSRKERKASGSKREIKRQKKVEEDEKGKAETKEQIALDKTRKKEERTRTKLKKQEEKIKNQKIESKEQKVEKAREKTAELKKKASVEKIEDRRQKSEDKKKKRPAKKTSFMSGEGGKAFTLKAGLPIVVDGDTVEFFERKGKIIATGDVVISYGETTLTCDRIEINTNTRRAICEGRVKIQQPKGALVGDRIRYDFAAERGEILGAGIEAFPWFGYADQSSKVGENEFLLMDGYVTTCDLNRAHYRIKGKEVRIFPNDKVIAKNVTFLVGKVPLYWTPYYYHPYIQTRSKVQFIPGRSNDWGNFLLSAWRFYLIGDTRVDVLVDYRSKKGFAEGAYLYYNTIDLGMPGLGWGMFRAYAIHQNKVGTYDPTPFRDEWRNPSDHEEGVDKVLRKMFQWKHRIDFDKSTVGMIEFNKATDSNVLKDYFYNEYEETGESISNANYASVITNQENYTFSVEAKKRFNTFYGVTQKLPEAKLNVPNQKLWETPFYYTAAVSGTVFDKIYASGTDRGSDKVKRLDFYHKLSYVTGLWALKVTPYGEFRETIYSRQAGKEDGVERAAVGGGLDASIRFYRIFGVVTNFLGLDINWLRHLVTPSVQYVHTEQPTVYSSKLFQMDDVDSIAKENKLIFAFENKLQTKRLSSISGNMESVDLVRFIVRSDYNFRFKKNKLEAVEYGPYRKHGRFDDVIFDLEFIPYDWLFLDSEMKVNPENQAVKTGSFEASITPWENFRMSMGYRYEKNFPNSRNQLAFDVDYIINPKWKIGWYERLDFYGREIEESQITITRDLHCWEVEVIYDLEGSRMFKDQYSLWVAFKIKAFPDLPLGLSRAFSKRKPGREAPGTGARDFRPGVSVGS